MCIFCMCSGDDNIPIPRSVLKFSDRHNYMHHYLKNTCMHIFLLWFHATAAAELPEGTYSLCIKYSDHHFARVILNRDFIKAIKEAVSVPVLANGGVRNYEELQECLEYTGADGYLSAEPLLGNPTLFSNPPFAPKPSKGQAPYPLEDDHSFQIFLEYIDICREHPTAPKIDVGHLHGIIGHWMHEFHDLRDDLNENRRKYADLDALTEWVEKLRARAKEVRETEGRTYPIRKMSEKQIERQKKREIAEAIAAQEEEEKMLKGTL